MGESVGGNTGCTNWAASAINAMTGNRLLYIHYWVDKNGNIGACSASGPSPDEVGKMISERKKQQEEQLTRQFSLRIRSVQSWT